MSHPSEDCDSGWDSSTFDYEESSIASSTDFDYRRGKLNFEHDESTLDSSTDFEFRESEPEDDVFTKLPKTGATKKSAVEGGGRQMTLLQASAATARSIVGPGCLYLPHGVASVGYVGAAVIFGTAVFFVAMGSVRLIESWQWSTKQMERKHAKKGGGNYGRRSNIHEERNNGHSRLSELSKDLVGAGTQRFVQVSVIGLQVIQPMHVTNI